MSIIKIAVASGKGGTGKTMVATCLANSLVTNYPVQFIDCDVEAPNAHLFLKPRLTQSQPAIILIPEINKDQCTACGKCVEICEFHALAKLGSRILVFPQLCHGCGSCTLNCPEKVIFEKSRSIGNMSRGKTDSGITYIMGELTISEPMPTPIIRQLKTMMEEEVNISIFDSPPGASCAVVATLHDADFVLMITEPTPFGLHDLKQLIGILKQIDKPGGVIINRDGIGDQKVEEFLSGTNYPVLMKIPYQNEIASGLAIGQLMTDIIPAYNERFLDLYRRINTTLHEPKVMD